ncbi:MAG: hypothetical protein HY906_10730, partial [Deltaproteobacteria bacterium]|nr:hypothetical protein [Deltaproteobacteria bacterium]
MVSFGALASGATESRPVTWTVPAPAGRGAGESNADYVARLQALNGTGLTTAAAATGTDAAGNALGAVSQSLSTPERLPILAFTPGSLTPFAPGQTQPLSVTVQNVGGADASTVTLTLTNPGGSTALATFALAAGASWSGSLNATAPTLAQKGAEESDAAYRARLAAFEGAALSFGLSLDWAAPGASFGTENASVAGTGQVPIVDIALAAPATARSGENVTYTVTLVNAGHAPTAGTTLRFTGLGGTPQVLAAPAVLAPGASVQIPVDEVVPTGLPSGPAQVRATVGWSDGAGGVYGDQSATASVTIQADPDLTVSVARPPLALPGQSLPLTFTVRNVSQVDAASAQVRVTRADGSEAGTATLPALAAGAVTAATVNVTAPPLAPKGADESDAAYRQRVLALSEHALSFNFALTWTGPGGGSYGPRGGTTSTYVVAPLVDVALTAPATANAGEALTYTVRLTSAGHADAAGLALTLALPDGTTQPVTTPATLPRGASLEIPVTWNCPAQQPAGAGTATARIAWADANGSSYGPQSAAATTTFTRGNQPPQVTVGPPQTITLPALATLTGTATDDGQPAALSYSWVKVSGPAEPTILDPRAATTQVSFTAQGTYVLRFTASDSQLTASAETSVTVLPRTGKGTTIAGTDPVEGEKLLHLERDAGGLRLKNTTTPLNFIWVAVTSKNTIVRIDTLTGTVLGEYRFGPPGYGAPSRTTVDSNGSVWVGTRSDSKNAVVHIGLLENGQCVDRNGNGVIDTSTGLNDIRPWVDPPGYCSWWDATCGDASHAEDECILHFVRTSAYGTRHLSVDANNDVWVSGKGNFAGSFDLIDGSTGQIKRREPSVGYGGYGGLIDRNGVIWSANALLRWDPALPLTGPNGINWRGYEHSSYGLCIDSSGNVWNTSSSGGLLRKFAPDGTLIGSYPLPNPAKGCAVDHNDDVWIGSGDYWNGPPTVLHYKNDGTYVGAVWLYPPDCYLCGGPNGVAVDAAGKIWAPFGYDQKAWRIDPNLGPIGADGVTPVGAPDLSTVPLGGYLYNYSDMTGSTLTGPPASGTWTFVYDSEQEGAHWGVATWTAVVFGDGALTVQVGSSTNGTTFSPLTTVTSGQPFSVPAGRYLQVNVRLRRSSTGESPILYDLTLGTLDYQLPATVNQPPVVDAGPDRTTTLPNAFRLTGSVRDDALPAGQLTTTWERISGPAAVTFGSVHRVATDVTFTVAGTYVLRLTATDGALSASDEMTVTVLPGNLPPVVNPGPSMAGTVATPVTLAGNVSDDGLPTGGVLTIGWSKLSGPGDVVFAPADAAATSATFSAAGTYVVRLTASDSALSSSADVVVLIDSGSPSSNRPPTVTAGLPQTIWLPAGVTLRGTASDSTLPGGPLQVAWSMVSGPAPVTFMTPNAVTTNVTFTTPGEYLMRLTATDSQLTASADTVVTVNPRATTNEAPTVSVTPAQTTLTMPLNTVLLHGSVSDDSLPEYGSLTSTWEQIDGPGLVAFGPGAPDEPYSTTAAFPYPGDYRVRLVVNDGAMTQSAVAQVTVLPDLVNHPPEVSIDGPGIVTGDLPAIPLLEGHVRDDGKLAGVVLALQWTQVSGPDEALIGLPTNPWTHVGLFAYGTYVFRLSAYDGEHTSSADVTVTVRASNTAPVVSAGPSQSLPYPQRTTTLVGSATDDGLPSGSLTVSWSKVSGPGAVTFSAPTQTTTDATFSLAGAYVLRLSASDGQKTGSADVSVTVGAPAGNLPTVAFLSPADGSVVTAPTDVLGSVSEGEWLLDYRAGGDDSEQPWTALASGTTPVTNATLGAFDPTMLLNGMYTLRLTATTAAGTATEALAVSVDKNFKVGNFTV